MMRCEVRPQLDHDVAAVRQLDRQRVGRIGGNLRGRDAWQRRCDDRFRLRSDQG